MHLEDADVTLPSLRMPPAGGFAPDQPDLGLGVPVDDLDRIVRALLAASGRRGRETAPGWRAGCSG